MQQGSAKHAGRCWSESPRPHAVGITIEFFVPSLSYTTGSGSIGGLSSPDMPSDRAIESASDVRVSTCLVHRWRPNFPSSPPSDNSSVYMYTSARDVARPRPTCVSPPASSIGGCDL